MSKPPLERTAAAMRRTRFPGWIWAVPIAALGIVVWLGVRAFVARGPTVEVTFTSAAGMAAGHTIVRYRGVEVGEVSDIALSSDLSHVTATLRLDASVAKQLNTGTRFWIVGAQLQASDLSALRTIISGPFIEMDPGKGKPTRRFIGLMAPPPVASGTKGTRFVLHAEQLGPLGPGSPVTYLGLKVGVVEDRAMRPGGHGFDLGIFVDAPYDKLVRPQTRFWNASAIALSPSGAGLEARLSSLAALVSGAVSFTTPPTPTGEPSKAGAAFHLYPDRGAARAAPRGQPVDYLVAFEGAVGGLHIGAPVTLKGFVVGAVMDVVLDYDPRSGTLKTPVTIALDPSRLKLGKTAGGPREAVDAALDTLIRQGLRARLTRSAPVIGGLTVALAFVPGAPPASLGTGGRYPTIPSAPSADIGALTAKAGTVLTRIAELPLGEIARHLQDAVTHLDATVSSPALAQSLTRLNETLANLDATTQSLHGKVGPLVDSLRKTADAAQATLAAANHLVGGGATGLAGDLPSALHEIADAARSVRALANYLDRHPEALLQGRSNR